MFLSDVDVRARVTAKQLTIDPFDAAALEGVTYRLRFGEHAYVLTGRSEVSLIVSYADVISSADTWVEAPLRNGALDVPPGSAVYVSTYEQLRVPLDLIGIILPFSSLTSLGLDLSLTFVQPGWSGRLVLLMRNVGPFTVRLEPTKSALAQVAFASLTTPSSYSYHIFDDVVASMATYREPTTVGRRKMPPQPRRARSRRSQGTSPGEDLRQHAELTRKITKRIAQRVILITDQAGSTSAMEKHLVGGASATVLQRESILDAVRSHGGRGEATGGDGTVSTFKTVGAAVQAACDARRRLGAHNRNAPKSDRIQARFAIHSGPIIEKEKLGPAYNVAARILNVAEPDQILISEDARSQAETEKVLFRFRFSQLLNAKGVDQPVPVFLVEEGS